MNKEQAIHVVEHLRGKRLSSLETMILAEAWDDQSYEYIAEISQRECQYVKKVGARLWREVSELTGAWINKRNFCSAMRRYYYNQLPQTDRCRLLAVSWEGAVGGEKQTSQLLGSSVKNSCFLPVIPKRSVLSKAEGSRGGDNSRQIRQV
ncbi:MAG: hypothetical protein GC158_10955 [Cyanobacteria bacterium RI_101]|nr:hypothetical protein [Cyanobacteria bacterium RI_101]